MRAQQAIIIGAGLAGLTAAYELLKRMQINPFALPCGPRTQPGHG